jgi:polar amino acid transport system substrate-binding protein
MTRAIRLAALLAVLIVAGAACSTPSDRALRRSLDPLPSAPPSTTEPASAPTSTTPPPCDPTASIEPGDIEPGAAIAQLRDHDRLVVGVDQGTYRWGFRDTTTGELSGLEVDLLKRIARELLGDENAIEFKTLTTANRITAVQNGDVDMVASLLTATCARWQQVDFSTVYFVAHQDVLVDEHSDIHTLDDLKGRTVCATRGSTSIANIAAKVPKATLYPVAARSDCMVALQDGTVDAITSDDTILRSFQRQELVPRTRQLGLDPSATESEPYAIAVNRDRPDLVRFVNRVLEDMRTDGSLLALYRVWLENGAPTVIPEATYR